MGRLTDWFLGTELERVEPLEGTNMSLYHSQIPAFWQETYGTPWYGTPQLTEQVWVSNRCVQMNAQQIAGMPLEFHGPPAEEVEPAWVSSPDPVWYPNGIGDALHAIVGAAVHVGVLLPVRHRLLRHRVPARVDGAAVRVGADQAGRRPQGIQGRRGDPGPGPDRPDRPQPVGRQAARHTRVDRLRAAGVGAVGRRQPVAGVSAMVGFRRRC